MFQPVDKAVDPFYPPHEVDEVVELILSDLSLRDKVIMANLNELELSDVYTVMGNAIRKEFRLMTENPELLDSCHSLAAARNEPEADPAMVIIKEMWRQLKETHRLRVVH